MRVKTHLQSLVGAASSCLVPETGVHIAWGWQSPRLRCVRLLVLSVDPRTGRTLHILYMCMKRIPVVGPSREPVETNSTRLAA